MATQTDPSLQPANAKAKSFDQTPQKTPPDVVSSNVTRITRQAAEPLTEQQRHDLIAVTAYYMAESRHFEPGHEDEDWQAAERQIQRAVPQ
jgi:Protein of unknown function (DUF2934)